MSTETKPALVLVVEMLAHGVAAVHATCRYCGHNWSAPIGFLPERTTLEKIGQLLVCPTCDRSEIDVEPELPATRRVH